jgi:flagellar basal-body rod modification protein FlgD
VYETTTSPRTAGEHLFTWNGTRTNGTTAPDGVYTISFDAESAGGEEIEPSVTVRETIMGVDFSGLTPLVITPSGTRGLDTIRSVLDVS